jgi:hypothetical protein
MPIDIEVHHDLKLIFNTAFGKVTKEHIYQKVRDTLGNEEYRGFNEVFDARNIEDIAVEYEDLSGLAATVAGYELTRRRRMAVVVADQLAFGMARQYESFSEIKSSGSLEVKVFWDFDEAVSWASQK